VDDDAILRKSLCLVLEHNGLGAMTPSNVNDALKLIVAETFDVLLSDLQMPNAGEGLTVVSAMRHSNPKAVTLILCGYSDMKAAAAAILLQTDEVPTQPMSPELLVQTIRNRLILDIHGEHPIESVLTILARETDLVSRLEKPLPLGTRALVSESAARHGILRRYQGYTPAMMVKESRMLQVSIFETLEHNLTSVDFNLLLGDVMAIADEVDSQLAQQVASYIAESKKDGKEIAP
jgi:ActR/RegA family two-component response regulator